MINSILIVDKEQPVLFDIDGNSIDYSRNGISILYKNYFAGKGYDVGILLVNNTYYQNSPDMERYDVALINGFEGWEKAAESLEERCERIIVYSLYEKHVLEAKNMGNGQYKGINKIKCPLSQLDKYLKRLSQH